MNELGNFVAYQVVWFAAVGGAARGWSWPGVGAALLFALWQLLVSRQRGAQVRLLGAALACGLLLDGALAAVGLVNYAAPVPALPPHGAPLWILALWVAFALTLTQSLRWLTTRPLAAFTLGALGGPLAYLAAERLGAVRLAASREQALLVLALGWALACWLLSRIAAAPAPERKVTPAAELNA